MIDARSLGAAFAQGYYFALGYAEARRREIAGDAWITAKPNGDNGKGRHIELDETGHIKAGLGPANVGKTIGQVVKENAQLREFKLKSQITTTPKEKAKTKTVLHSENLKFGPSTDPAPGHDPAIEGFKLTPQVMPPAQSQSNAKQTSLNFGGQSQTQEQTQTQAQAQAQAEAQRKAAQFKKDKQDSNYDDKFEISDIKNGFRWVRNFENYQKALEWQNNPQNITSNQNNPWGWALKQSTLQQYQAAQRVRQQQAKDNYYPKSIAQVKQGAKMTHEQADEGKGNPKFNPHDSAYSKNCQSCVVVYDMRRRGYDVKAKAWENKQDNASERLSENYYNAYINPDGSTPQSVKLKVKSRASTIKELHKQLIPGREYIMGCKWKDKPFGHVFRVWKDKNGVVNSFDPQTGEHDVLKKYLPRMKYQTTHKLRWDKSTHITYHTELLDTTNLSFNPVYMNQICEAV